MTFNILVEAQFSKTVSHTATRSHNSTHSFKQQIKSFVVRHCYMISGSVWKVISKVITVPKSSFRHLCFIPNINKKLLQILKTILFRYTNPIHQ